MPLKSGSRADWARKAAACAAASLAAVGALCLRVEPAYRYEGDEVATVAQESASYRLEASAAPVAPSAAKVTVHRAEFSGRRDMVTVKIWGADPEHPPRVTLMAGGASFPLEVDVDGGEADAGEFLTTDPLFLDGVTRAAASVDWGRGEPGEVALAAVDTSAHGWRLSFGRPARADGVVTRAQWGADEELRFADTAAWKKVLKSNVARKPTAAEKKAAAKRQRIYEWLHAEYPWEFEGASRRKQENGRDLIWPVENAGYFDKIAVHHTGEWTDSPDGTPRDEASVMRGIYYYHAHVRQWGDIGYNYVVGKSGAVYEGRAGGDYAVAAHAVWNNQTTAGVSLMGAYDRQVPPKEQIVGMVRLIAALSRKYGIDLSAQRDAHRECVGKNCKRDGETIAVPGLSGHRDMGHTNCPGSNLYPILAKVRELENFSRGRNPIPRSMAAALAASKGAPATQQRPQAASAEAAAKTAAPEKPDADKILGAAAETFSADAEKNPVAEVPARPQAPAGSAVPADAAARSADDRAIRVRLSAPELPSFHVGPADGGVMALSSGKQKGTAKNYLVLEKSGKSGVTVRLADRSITFAEPVRLSGGILEVKNWSRVPAWDKDGKNNDNKFRGTLEIRNRGGKWLVVNELPVGDYVKGLGEVSEGDPEAKAKTIIVAARTYAAHYLQADKRKFPGEPYDGSDDPAVFQRYLGYGLEARSPSLSRYADETRNVVITYQGRIIKPWYFNASTGKTRSAKQYCEAYGGKKCEDVPFLQSVVDPGTPSAKYLGHGVGISGNGATELAKRGWTFEAIIGYFLKGVEVGRVE